MSLFNKNKERIEDLEFELELEINRLDRKIDRANERVFKMKTPTKTPKNTELKTLKDIRRCGEFEDDINPEELKQEAIKWVKYNIYALMPMPEAFKIFFNLTEADLK